MVIKELEKLVEFMESDYWYDWLDRAKAARRYLIDIINGLSSVQNISGYEKGILKILAERINQGCKIHSSGDCCTYNFTANSVPFLFNTPTYIFKNKNDYINEVKTSIKLLKDYKEERVNELIENYKNITKEVEEVIKQSDELKDIAKEHHNNLKGYI